MKPLLRGLFVALIALGLATQTLRATRVPVAADTMAVLRDRLEKLNITMAPAPIDGFLRARSPMCEQQFLVGLKPFSGGDDDSLNALDGSELSIVYGYEGNLFRERHGVAMIGQWVWSTTLFRLGLRPDGPAQEMVVVAIPHACDKLMTVDWSVLSR